MCDGISNFIIYRTYQIKLESTLFGSVLIVEHVSDVNDYHDIRRIYDSVGML